MVCAGRAKTGVGSKSADFVHGDGAVFIIRLCARRQRRHDHGDAEYSKADHCGAYRQKFVHGPVPSLPLVATPTFDLLAVCCDGILNKSIEG
jgi:hypothetical protein